MLTEKQKKHLRAELLETERHLKDELQEHTARVANEHPGYSSHMADDASDVYEQEKEGTVRQTLERDLQLVQAALHRMEHDTYGTCERCGKEIDPDRLEAIPYARFCTPCQAYMEKRYP